MPVVNKYILGIESSCDDTAASILCDDVVLSNVIASQNIHKQYGGVVPELASRAHQSNIVVVVDQALQKAGISLHQIDVIGFTSSPGLLGSLLVGSSFAKALAISLNKPIYAINHLSAHVFALFIQKKDKAVKTPEFPFICLTVSGGHTQIVIVKNFLETEIIGNTLDDAAGEAFDKIGKMLNLPYPAGPLIDKISKTGNEKTFDFPKAKVPGYNYSFSGIKTSVLYFLQKNTVSNDSFIEQNIHHICASVQHVIVNMLLEKLKKAAKDYSIQQIGVVGGVSANSYLRKALQITAEKLHWNLYLPDIEFCTDNAAMIAYCAYLKHQLNKDEGIKVMPSARTIYT